MRERVYDVASKYCIFCFRTSVVKEVRGANESVLWPSRWQGYVYRIDAKNPYSIHREGGKKLGQWLAETNLWDWCKSIFLALGEWRGDTKLAVRLSFLFDFLLDKQPFFWLDGVSKRFFDFFDFSRFLYGKMLWNSDFFEETSPNILYRYSKRSHFLSFLCFDGK